MPRVISVGTALPEWHYRQAEVAEVLRKVYRPLFEKNPELIRVFENSRVEDRYFVRPFEELMQLGTFVERNKIFAEAGYRLAERAVQECLAAAQLDPGAISGIVFVSTTGFSVPSLETTLINRLGFHPATRRWPIFGWGCTGGVAGLAQACAQTRADPRQRILLVAVELCSLAYQARDLTQKALIASAIFNDGAAAVLVAGDEATQPQSDGPQILAAKSHLYPATQEVMGWEQVETGLQVVLSPRIPELVRDDARRFLASLTAEAGKTIADLNGVLSHTGGARILQALEEVLGLELKLSWETLRKFGNLSSASILFTLKAAMQNRLPAKELGALVAFGPGFSAEGLLVQW